MNKELEVLNDVEKAIYGDIENSLLNDKKFQRLLLNKDRAAFRRDYMGIAAINKEIEDYKEKEVKRYIEILDRDRSSLMDLSDLMTEDERFRCVLNSHMIVMFAKWIEGCNQDMNKVLDRYLPGGRITLYDNLRKMGRETANIMANLGKTTSMGYQAKLNEHSSKLYLQIESQVKMFIKRDKENE